MRLDQLSSCSFNLNNKDFSSKTGLFASITGYKSGKVSYLPQSLAVDCLEVSYLPQSLAVDCLEVSYLFQSLAVDCHEVSYLCQSTIRYDGKVNLGLYMMKLIENEIKINN